MLEGKVMTEGSSVHSELSLQTLCEEDTTHLQTIKGKHIFNQNGLLQSLLYIVSHGWVQPVFNALLPGKFKDAWIENETNTQEIPGIS